jgi:hypothetical protein
VADDHWLFNTLRNRFIVIALYFGFAAGGW